MVSRVKTIPLEKTLFKGLKNYFFFFFQFIKHIYVFISSNKDKYENVTKPDECRRRGRFNAMPILHLQFRASRSIVTGD